MKIIQLYIIYLLLSQFNISSTIGSDCEVLEKQISMRVSGKNTVWHGLDSFYCEVSYVNLSVDPDGKLSLKSSSIISKNVKDIVSKVVIDINESGPYQFCDLMEYDFVFAVWLSPNPSIYNFDNNARIDKIVDNFKKLYKIDTENRISLKFFPGNI